MTDLEQIHKFIDFVSDKDMNGWVSPEEKDMSLHRASMWLFQDCFRSYSVNQKSQDDLAPFKKSYTFTNSTSPGGLITLPPTYQHFLGGWIQGYDNVREQITYTSFDIVNDDELAERISSQLLPISEVPVAQWVGKGKMQLWPKAASAGYVSYLKYPEKPSFVYNTSGREIIYDAVGSTQLEWDEVNINKIIHKALSYLGINLDSDKLINYVEQFNQQ